MRHSASLKFSPSFKRLLLFIVGLYFMVGVWQVTASFSPDKLYTKDIIQEYLMAKAILNGVNPYLPLTELSKIWMSYANYNWMDHPTPHPPALALLCLPLGYFSYEVAVLIWLGLELIGVLVTIWLFLRWWGSRIKATNVSVLFMLAIGWLPVIHELWFGQLNIGLLLLLIGVWFALRTKRDFLGGMLLGTVIALKLIAWPVLIFLTLRRRWRSVAAACLVASVANLLAIAILGGEIIKTYYFKVGPLVASIYRTYDYNYSVWTLGSRFFRGSGAHYRIPPLWHSEALASLCDLIAPIIVLLFVLALAWKAVNFDTSFGLLIGVSILVSPTAWTYNLVLAAIPIAIILRRLKVLEYPKKICYLLMFMLLMPTLGGGLYNALVLIFARLTPNNIPTLPFFTGIITLTPAAALSGILWVLWSLDAVNLPQHNQGISESESFAQTVS